MEPSPIRRLEQPLNLENSEIQQRLNKIENKIEKIITLLNPLPKDIAKDNEIIFNEDNGQSPNKEVLEYAAERLLNCDQMNILDEKIEPSPEYANPIYDMKEQYADLVIIFPEADPAYLKEVADKMYSDPEAIKEFIQSQLENPDYPTITERRKQYTTDFQAQQFLEIFPDPFLYFEDNERICKFNKHAVNFLKFHFSKLKIITLQKAYYRHNFNLSLAVKDLEPLNNELKQERYYDQIYQTTKDISFLQECAFIQNKTELRYCMGIELQKMEEFNELKATNKLLECQCCYDNECMPTKCFSCQNGHIFCKKCIARGADIVLRKGNKHINCLLQCGGEFSMEILQKVLPPTKFNILLCNWRKAAITTTFGLTLCPHCRFAFKPPLFYKIKMCPNLNCNQRISCHMF